MSKQEINIVAEVKEIVEDAIDLFAELYIDAPIQSKRAEKIMKRVKRLEEFQKKLTLTKGDAA